MTLALMSIKLTEVTMPNSEGEHLTYLTNYGIRPISKEEYLDYDFSQKKNEWPIVNFSSNLYEINPEWDPFDYEHPERALVDQFLLVGKTEWNALGYEGDVYDYLYTYTNFVSELVDPVETFFLLDQERLIRDFIAYDYPSDTFTLEIEKFLRRLESYRFKVRYP